MCNDKNCMGSKIKKILVVCTTDSMIWNFLIPHIQDLMAAGYQVDCVCSVTGIYFNDLKVKYGFCMFQIDIQRSPYHISNIRAYTQLNKIISKEKYNIIFCHEPMGGVLGRIAGHANHCKVIYMAHGFHFYKGASLINRFVYYWVEKRLSAYTDVLITINKEDYAASCRFHAARNVLLNGIGVDTSKFSYTPDPDYLRIELGLGKEDLILLSVGELILRKNHKVVIETIASTRNCHIHYVIAGEGVLRSKLENMVKKLGLSKQIHFLGYRTDIGKLCNAADVFILPSFQEGLSVALMEAMACGKPVIASAIRGNVDLIDAEKGEYLVPVESIIGYSNAIRKMESMEERKQFGEYNRNKIKAFDIQNVRKQMREIFQNIDFVSGGIICFQLAVNIMPYPQRGGWVA